MKMRNNRALGFLGFPGFYGSAGLIHGDWLQSVWIVFLLVSPGSFLKKNEPVTGKARRDNPLYMELSDGSLLPA